MPKLTENTVVLSNEEFDSLAKIKKISTYLLN